MKAQERDGAVSLQEALLTQHAVMHGLILREMQARYGRSNIGFLWIVLEPLLLASVITGIHALSPDTHMTGDMRPYPFTVIAYCLVIVFRNNFSKAESGLTAGQNLLYHAHVSPLDIMLSRMICETFGILVAFIILMGGGIAFDLADWPARPLYLFLAVAEIGIWSFGLSLVAASLSLRYHVVGRFVHPIAYFMFPLSGAFFTMTFLPFWAREYMAWNPLMIMFETARYGQFRDASADWVESGYAIMHCGVALFLGVLAVRRARRYIHVH